MPTNSLTSLGLLVGTPALESFGLKFSAGGAHISRTMMLAEFEAVLAAVPAGSIAEDYRAANNGVSKVSEIGHDAGQIKTLRFELQNFVCDGEYARGMERILSAYLGGLGKAEQNAVWVSGFFGSGKSHLVKVLRYLWEDYRFDDNATARSLVTLPAEISAMLTELSNRAKPLGGLRAAAGTLGAGSMDNVRLAFIQLVLRAAGLPENLAQARFILWLRASGLEAKVQAALKLQNRDLAKEVLSLKLSIPLAEALVAADPKYATPANAQASIRDEFKDSSSPTVDDALKIVKQIFGEGGQLAAAGIESTQDWEWSAIPSVTATAKPAASPIADAFQGGDPGDEFGARLTSTGQLLNQSRFVDTLKARGWQCLAAGETGNPAGSAWTEAGTLDKRGHTEGWKLARSVEAEVQDLVSRIRTLLQAGWTDLVVVTDHGWLLMPGGLPKVELKAFLTETRWSRCAALKTEAQTDAQAFKWYWNPTVMMASPPGAGSYRAGIEYAHGGVSLQEIVTPVLRISAAQAVGAAARLIEAKWTGAKCRVVVGGEGAGMRVDVRTSQTDPNTSLLTDKQAREITADGKVTVFLEDDADIGKQAEVVLLDASGQVIHALPTTLGN